jgi:foldase protein PrsA
MRKYIIVFALFLFFPLISCSQEPKEAKLREGMPAYQLAKDLSLVLPVLDPDANTVLISSNNFQITTGEVIQSFYSMMGKRTEQLKNIDAEKLKTFIIQSAEQIAERKLLKDAAEKADISYAAEELDNALNYQYNRAGGEDKFLQMLEENGIDFSFVKESIMRDLLIQKYLDDLFASKIQVSEEEIQKAYEGDKTASVRHILLMTGEKNETEKEEVHRKMEELLARARSGEDFAELAKEFSEDTGSKNNGGLYENFGRGEMVKPFEDAAFSVPEGEISDIIETTYGYHILKVIDRKKETRPIEEVRSEIEDKLKQTKRAYVFKEHMEQLKEEAALKIVEF